MKPKPTEQDLAIILEAMLVADETITFNAVSREAPALFPHASSLTRRPAMADQVKQAMTRQEAVRHHASKIAKSGPATVAARLQAAEARIQDLEDKNRLLVAGLRAALLSVGRIGGMAAWKEYFPVHSEAFRQLQAMKGIPSAEIVQLSGSPLEGEDTKRHHASTPSPSASAPMLSIERLRSERSTDPT